MQAEPGAPRTLPDWLWQKRRQRTLALRHRDAEWTYADLGEIAARLAGELAARGVRPGERVAVLARHAAVFTAALHALRFCRAVAVPVNVRLAAPEIAWQLADAGARFAVCDEAHAGLLRQAADGLPRLVLDGVRFPEGEALWALEVALSDVQSIVYTSGTTGRPKGARITYGNHFYGAAGSAFRLGVLPADVWYTPLPLFHVGGQAVLMRSAVYGTAARIDDSFDPARANAALDAGAALCSAVPNMLVRMLEERGARPYPASLRCILLGGGPAPRPLLAACAGRRIPVSQSYGLTEANSQAATLAAADGERKLGSAGLPLPLTEVRIVAGGAAAPPFAEGEIALRGPTVADGYDHLEAETGAAFRDGWLYTGDIGYLDDEGYLYVLDRRSDLIVSGGENVYPAEVEAVLLAHPDVAEAGVAGVADGRYGQVPLAVVRPRGQAPAEEELRAFCRARLAAYKVPRHIRFADELPRNAAGKLLRKELGRWL